MVAQRFQNTRFFVFALIYVLIAALPSSTRPSVLVLAGLRVSRGAHFNPFPPPQYFDSFTRAMARPIVRARPCLIWIVGLYWKDGEIGLSFPAPEGIKNRYLHFASTDENEDYLEYFDTHDIDVWLEVEPGNADVQSLIDLVLRRYGHHPCVVGFGIDVEWYRTGEEWDGKPVSDDEARAWNDSVKAYRRTYRLFLKHYKASKMPRTERGDILFLNDSQRLPSLRSMVHEFRDWGARFRPADVGFQYGYPADRSWWSRYEDPAETITRILQQNVPNARAFFWVDFTAREIHPY